MVKIFTRKKDRTKTQKFLFVAMWVLGVSTLIPYLVFCFSYPFVENRCNYETGKCPLVPSLALDIAMGSFKLSYYAWWLLAPAALLCGLVYAGIGVYRQLKRD